MASLVRNMCKTCALRSTWNIGIPLETTTRPSLKMLILSEWWPDAPIGSQLQGIV